MYSMAIIQWKGKTFNQITSLLQKNSPVVPTHVTHNLFTPNPLKIYRREIVTAQSHPCSSRVSSSIDEFDRPNGSLVNSSCKNGLVNTLDFGLTNNTTELPGICKNPIVSPVVNALKRVRSAGMIKKQYDISKNNDTYCTSTNQYLVARNRSFQQNQYNYIRQGNSQVKPGDGLSSQNLYSAQGINHCRKYQITTDVSFQYQWIDSNYYTVNISAGYYNFDDINQKFQDTMIQNYHFFVNKSNNSRVFLLSMTYNNSYQKIEFHVVAANNTIFNTSNYQLPLDPYGNTITTWTTPSSTVVPGFKIFANAFQSAIGFTAGNYPTIAIGAGSQTPLTNQVFLSTYTPGVQPLYVPVYYKPSNPQFAEQGGVSSSSLIARVKYNTITNNTVIYRKAYGTSVANALAYGVPENGYTYKDKLGYPLKKTPVFSKYSGELESCNTCTPVVSY